MFESGPALMEVNRLHGELETIKNDLDSHNNNKYEYSPARCNNFNNYFSNPKPTPTTFKGARPEYERGLRNIEDFHNRNHNHDDNYNNNSNDSDDDSIWINNNHDVRRRYQRKRNREIDLGKNVPKGFKYSKEKDK